jgi:3-phenylpropionate/cinnamic acid dioxygenase small subunit
MTDAALYPRVQEFYARQMGLMDDDRADEWADTFTEDGEFREPSRLEPLAGREAIRVSARGTVERRLAAGQRIRHWLGMLQLDPGPDGTLLARSYALAMRVPRAGGALDVFASVVCLDVLVPDGDGWLVRRREITHDGAEVRA